MTNTRTLSYDRACNLSLRFKTRVDRLARSYDARARKLATEAGLCSQFPFLHAHNAMVSYRNGKPWKNVNYDTVHKVMAMETKIASVWQLYYRYSDKQFKNCFQLAHYG